MMKKRIFYLPCVLLLSVLLILPCTAAAEADTDAAATAVSQTEMSEYAGAGNTEAEAPVAEENGMLSGISGMILPGVIFFGAVAVGYFMGKRFKKKI